MNEISQEQNIKLESLKKFLEKSDISPNLPLIDVLEEIRDILKEVSSKETPETPDVQKMEIQGAEIITIKGKEGEPPTDEHLLELITPLIPDPIKGDDGEDYVLTETDKREIAKSITVPIVERVVETIVEKQPIVTNEIKEVAVTDNGEVIVGKINGLDSESDNLKIDISHIKGIDILEKSFDSKISSIPRGTIGGGGNRPLQIQSSGVIKEKVARVLNFIGSGVNSIVRTADGVVTISLVAGAGSTVYSETPSGLINGSNTIYTTANTITNVLSFAINGQFIHPSEYSAVGTTITFVTALDASLSGLAFTIVYS